MPEKPLRESEEQYRTLFEKYPVGTVIVDNEGRVTRYNLVKKNSDASGHPAGDNTIQDADNALYGAKRQGRDRLRCVSLDAPGCGIPGD